MFESTFFSPFTIPIVAIIGGISVAIVNSIGRARVRELEIRERIAMIEHGMVPPPETDPSGFERQMHAVDQLQYRQTGARFRSGGVMVMFVGFGLITLLWFVGIPREAIGVGGLVVFIGLGLLVNSVLSSSYPAPSPPPRPESPATPQPRNPD